MITDGKREKVAAKKQDERTPRQRMDLFSGELHCEKTG
jgi:hypothetical protein